MNRVVVSLTLGILLAGCGGASKDTLLNRASFDLNCPEHKLNVVEIDAKTRGVSGCDQQVTYIEKCDDKIGPDAVGPRASCVWEKNSEVTKEEEKKK